MIRTPNIGKEYLFLIIAVLPALTPIIVNTDLYKFTEMEVTMLEWKNQTDSLEFESKAVSIIYNVGNVALTNVIVTYNTENKDQLISFDSIDGSFLKQEYLNDNLILHIERISPGSNVKITTNGNIISDSKRTISITSDNTPSQTILLPKFIHGGTTTINFVKDSTFIYYSMLLILLSLILFRYYSIKYSENLRKKFPNYNLRHMTFWSRSLFVILIIVIAGHFALAYYYNTNQPVNLTDYSIGEPFEFNEKLNEKIFYNYPVPTDERIINTIIISIYGIMLFGFIIIILPLPRPVTKWFIGNIHNVPISKISNSYSRYQILPLKCKVKNVKKSSDIIVLVNEQRTVCGLISKKELGFMDIKKNFTFDSILNNVEPNLKWHQIRLRWHLLNKKIRKKMLKFGLPNVDELEYPSWDSNKQLRDNFVIITPDVTIKEAENQIKSSNKKYAVISTKNNCIKGVLNYSRLPIMLDEL